jgi:hypothetical protein
MPVFRRALLAALVAAPLSAQPTPARAIVDTAVARMGGRAALESLRTVQYEILTQWLNLAADAQPMRDRPSYERQTEWRDYRSRTWRNVRRFVGPALTTPEVVDVVVDTVGARRLPPGMPGTPTVATPAAAIDRWVPLNVAYVDERRELFAWAPERVVLELSAARDLAARPDTTIGGDRHAVVTATIDGFPFTAFFRRASGLPTAVRYRADETNDFGLAPFGPMEVEIWYSMWAPNAAPAAAGVTLPRQWDTKRVGKPYKRMTVLGATFNAPMAADSLAFPDTVRTLAVALGRKPMGDLPIDSAVVLPGGAAVQFYGSASPSGAVRVGGAWHLLDGGNLAVNAERAAAWLEKNASGGAARTTASIVTATRPASIALWAARGGRRTYVSPAGAEPVRRALGRFGASAAGVQVVARGQWLGAGTRDSLWVEPIELANGGGLVVYAPAQRWAYSGAVTVASDLALVAAAVRRRGWAVDRIGMPGRLAGMPAPGGAPAATGDAAPNAKRRQAGAR